MIKKIILVLVVLGAIGGFIGYRMYNKKTTDAVSQKSDVTITATALAKDFGTDEKTANTKYLNKNIEVSGMVSEIDKNQEGGLLVMLETGDPINVVQCSMDSTYNNNTTINKGQSVTIKGFCSGYNMGVALTRCGIKK